MTFVLDDFFLSCTCGFLHFEPWERGKHNVLLGRVEKPGQDLVSVGLMNHCRANLGHRDL